MNKKGSLRTPSNVCFEGFAVSVNMEPCRKHVQETSKTTFPWYPCPLQTFTASFYMGKFGGSTPKPHRVWSNDERLLSGLTARAGFMSKAEQSCCPGQTVKKYIDKNGKKRHVGIKNALKDSQSLSNWFQCRCVGLTLVPRT